MDWQDEYESKMISAEKAASFVKSGDQVVFTAGREAFAIGLAMILSGYRRIFVFLQGSFLTQVREQLEILLPFRRRRGTGPRAGV